MITLQMYTLRTVINDRESFAEAVRRAAEIGCGRLQVKCPAYLTLAEFRGVMSSNGLSTDSLSAKLAELPEKLGQIVSDARFLGVDRVRVEAMPRSYADSPEGFLRYAKMLDGGGRLLRENGLTLVYHFHAFEFVNFPDGRRGIDLLLSETSPENVTFQPDVFWLTAAGCDAADELARFAGRAVMMHVKDYAIRPRPDAVKERIPCVCAPVGRGNIGWARVIETAKRIGVTDFVVEQDDCYEDDPFDCIRESCVNLKKLLGE